MKFRRYVGIDYSGAQTPDTGLKGLQLYAAAPGAAPVAVRPAGPARHWSRRALAHWLLAGLLKEPLLIGIDCGFSLPEAYFQRYGLTSWPLFLDDFCRHWPTHLCAVDAVRDGSIWKELPRPAGERCGGNTELRLCERWTSSAKSVFLFDVQGSVAKSTHAAIPWLRFLREQAGDALFFWPFDGWRPPRGTSVIAEVYPSIFRHRYPREGRTADEHDAYAVARWLEETDRRGALGHYFDPPLVAQERACAALEGWILGIA